MSIHKQKAMSKRYGDKAYEQGYDRIFGHKENIKKIKQYISENYTESEPKTEKQMQVFRMFRDMFFKPLIKLAEKRLKDEQNSRTSPKA